MTHQNLPADLHGRTFTVREALASGVSRSRLRATDLTRFTRGTRSPSGIDDADVWRAQAEAVLSVLPPGCVLSHTTALAAHGIQIPYDMVTDHRTHVWLPPGAHMVRRAAVRDRRSTRPVPQVRVSGFPATPLPRTFVDLVDVEPRVLMLVALGDAIVHHGVDPDELVAAVAAASGRRGVKVLRESVGQVRRGAESVYESLTRCKLVAAGLPEPALQHVVRVPGLAYPYRADMAWPDAALAVEYLGQWHREDRTRWERDQRRTNLLQQQGICVYHVTRQMVFDPQNPWVQEIRALYHERTQDAPASAR